MHTRIVAAGLLALVLVAAPVLFAQNEREGTRGHNYRANTLKDLNVKNGTDNNAETLGYIEDIVLDLRSGNVLYYALAHGRTLGFGGKLFAIAPSALKLTEKGDFFILEGVTNQQLDNAEGFNTNDWPHEPNTKLGRVDQGAIEKGAKEIAKEVKEAVQGKAQLARLSSVIGMACRTPQNESLGTVYDLSIRIDGPNQKVAYVMVSHGGTLGVGGKLYPVPLNKMHTGSPRLKAGERVFILNTTPDRFTKLRGYTSNDTWPRMPDEQFWSKVGDEREDRNNNRDR